MLLPGRLTISTTTESATTSAQAVDRLASTKRATTAVGVVANIAMQIHAVAPGRKGEGKVDKRAMRGGKPAACCA